MKLYYTPGSCSLSPHIVLREAGLSFDLEKVDLKAKKTEKGADYLAVNAKGYVPALALDNGQVLTEGPAIVQWIADQRPESGLAPKAGTPERYRLMEWLGFVSTELHKGISPLWRPDTPDAYKATVRDNLAKRFDYLERHLGANAHLMGAQFSVADAYAFTILNWTNILKIDMGRWPKIQAYMARMAERPKVKEAMKAEGIGG